MGANTKAVAGADTSLTYTPNGGSGTVTDVSNLPYALGTVIQRITSGIERRFKLVLVEDLALAAGNAVCYTTDDNNYEVTADRSGGTSDNGQPAGVALGTVTDGDACWIQTFGPNLVAMVTDGSVAADEEVKAHASTDGGLDSNDGVSSLAFGQALDADTGSAIGVGEVFLDCPKG